MRRFLERTEHPAPSMSYIRLFAALILLSLPAVAAAGAFSPSLLLSPTSLAEADDVAAGDGDWRLPEGTLRASRLPNGFEIPDQPDRDGLRKDTYYFVFSQFFVIGILYVMPEDISGWTDEQKDNFTLSKYTDNISEIRWDSDRWWINYVLHPYWGGAYYVRARERGYDDDQAFWYSVLLSTMFEYGAEAIFEVPSIQDLILTPGLGYFFGRYMMGLRDDLRAQLRAGHELSAGDRAMLFVTDPLGSVNKALDRMFGIRGDYQFSPFMVTPSAQSAFHQDDLDEGPHAVVAGTIAPGLQLHLRW